MAFHSNTLSIFRLRGRALGYASASVVAMTMAHTASAQTAAPAEQAQQGGLEEIIVTAQRRSERQQDVPIAISTVTASAAARQGVTGTESLGIAVPSLQFNRQVSNGGVPFLRGVGSAQGSAGAESPVATYVDDVYMGSSTANALKFNNIESVEVLKGPQGTLFGRNATGGVIHVHTKKPSHTTAVDASAGFGSYNTYTGNLYATTGLSDKVAVNFAAMIEDQSKGYGYNYVTGTDIFKGWTYGLRGQLLWEPSSETSVLLTADYAKGRGDRGLGFIPLPGTVANGGQTNRGPFLSGSDPADWSAFENYGFSGRIEQALGKLKLVSVTAWRNTPLQNHFVSDGRLPGVPRILYTDAYATQRNFSQEVQLVSPTADAFHWILGAYYYHGIGGYLPLIYTGSSQASLGGLSTTQTKQTLNSYAGFGEASYEFLPDTKLTAGLRYTTDSFDFDALQTRADGTARTPTPFKQHDSFSKLTYRAILDHKFSRDLMIYGSYSRGFKSGGYNVSSPTITVAGALQPAPVVAPEVLDAYEVGFKSELFDNILRLNVSAFHYKYSNMQVSVVFNGPAVTLNAAKAKINGVDIDWNFVPTKRFNLSGGFSFLDTKFLSFPGGTYSVPNPANCATLSSTGPATGGNTVCVADLTGNRTPRAPKFAMSLSATYTLPTEVGDFSLNGTIYHNSGYFWESSNITRQPQYDLLNLALTWTSSNGKYEAKVYGRNLLNEYYYS